MKTFKFYLYFWTFSSVYVTFFSKSICSLFCFYQHFTTCSYKTKYLSINCIYTFDYIKYILSKKCLQYIFYWAYVSREGFNSIGAESVWKYQNFETVKSIHYDLITYFVINLISNDIIMYSTCNLYFRNEMKERAKEKKEKVDTNYFLGMRWINVQHHKNYLTAEFKNLNCFYKNKQ